jgi:hypothetical protein
VNKSILAQGKTKGRKRKKGRESGIFIGDG